MKYMLTLFGEEGTWDELTPEQMGEQMARWDAYTTDLGAAFVAGEGLAPSATATTIRMGGERVVTDGPFAETKEQLGGFYVIDVDDLDAAIEWAQRIPMDDGAVEVRPVMDYEAVGSTEHASAAKAS